MIVPCLFVVAIIFCPTETKICHLEKSFAETEQIDHTKEFPMVASWYGADFDGQKMANGEVFNKEDLVAAHPTLPFGTRLTLTNPDNQKTVLVTVKDRGPFVSNREIDVSEEVACRLSFRGQGVKKLLARLEK